MEEMEKFTCIDGNGKEITLTKEDFLESKKDAKIYDLKFNTKATTFFKDAMKRFVKSKSALVGGIIVLILMLSSIIVPFCTPDVGVYNTDVNNGGGSSVEAKLSPKLFDAGTGFWDGTVKRTHVLYDNVNQCPVDIRMNAVSDLRTYEEISNLSNEHATGGSMCYYMTTEEEKGTISSRPFFLNSSLDYNIKFELYNYEEDASYVLNGYKFYLQSNEEKYYLLGSESQYVTTLSDEFSLFDRLTRQDLSGCTLNWEFAGGKVDEKLPSFIISSFNITSTSEDELITDFFNNLSFKDGNALGINEDNPWTKDSKVRSIPYQVNFTYCDFTFDQYEDAYGLRIMDYGHKEVQLEVNRGYLVVDFSNGTQATTDKDILSQRFKVIDPQNSLICEVVEQVNDAIVTGNKFSGFSLKIRAYNYKKLGYSEMPRFIFGTDANSKDFCKLLFTGLRFSFLIAIGVSAVNILIGLVWGSISGYFGGWTDIVMERICDILSGLPSTVIITLAIMYGREANWGSASDVIALMIALFMTGWMGVSGRTRTQFYRYKGREYVLASRTLGAKDSRLIFKHILPNASGTIITGSILMIPSVIYTESSIAYLGLGLQNQVLFGVILAENNSNYRGEVMYLLLIPTLIMVMLMIAFNLFGNGLRDAFNPSLKGGE